jgi:dienelactone hydrolase/pimeloyl-ACP methyl ester carboxylesterase
MGTSRPTRRHLIRTSAAALTTAGLSSAVTAPVAHAADSAPAPSSPAKLSPAIAPALAPLNRFPRMVHEHFVRRVREIEHAGNARRAALRTRADAEQYVADVREKIRASFGPFPEITPLNAKVTGILRRDGYRVEKVIFESRPQFFVTANLYIPEGRKSKMPAVVGSCGHSTNGKGEEAYQSFAQGLSRQGYVVLIFDPLGQGERLQYPDEKLKSRISVGVGEHLYAGNQQFLVGQFLGSWRAWDGIRALDYLLSRDEVDPLHLGITGNSGGGTMTTWLCGVEQRWTMAAPSCFVTTFRRNLENELPADTEQCPPRALALGLDHADFLAALAPKPIIVLSQEKDFFDTRGTAEAFERLSHLYGLLGAADNVAFFRGPRPHGYSIENRQAMYQWFNRCTGIAGPGLEPALKLEKNDDLLCTPRGQVVDLGSRPVYSYTKEISQQLAKQRKPLEGAALREAVAAALKLPARGGPPDYRILRPTSKRNFPTKGNGTYAVVTEPGIHALVYLLTAESHVSRPPQGIERAVLYVSDRSADAELRDEPLVREILAAEADKAASFYACDVRGIGESQPNTCGIDNVHTPYGSDYFYAIHSIMLDTPYLGQRTHDVLALIDWLESNGHKEIHLVAKGWGTLPATFAALLSPRVTHVTLKNALTSYSEVAESERYGWPLAALLPEVLKTFDLPDCYRALAQKNLRQIEPWGADGGGKRR